MISEFELIAKYFTQQSVRRDDVVLGIGDDGAVLRAPVGQCIVASVDTLVEGVHFLPDISPLDLGYRALAVNLSDLAAMGAQPAWAMLAITLPRADDAWLAAFSRGFFELARRHNVQLVGGNTTRGPLNICAHVHGFAPERQILRRNGASPGDLIYVTGTLGDAGLGLQVALNKIALPKDDAHRAMQCWLRPVPRVNAGIALRGIASACIDVSDGLLADLEHICAASHVGATLTVDQLPVSEWSRAGNGTDWNVPLTAGEDYELCFTAPPTMVIPALDTRVTCIGKIDAQTGVRCHLRNGETFYPVRRGYDHFAAAP